MRHIISLLIVCALCSASAIAQNKTIEGKCNSEISWSFDGHTLHIFKTDITKSKVAMPNYNTKSVAPWIKRKLPIKKIYIDDGITSIGECAFMGCSQLETVEFYNGINISEIGWGAFLRCGSLFNISIPQTIKKIGKLAFAECKSLRSVIIPSQATVDDFAFLSCTNLNVIDLAVNSSIGKSVFASEKSTDNGVFYTYFNGEIRSLPATINADNSQAYGISKDAVKQYISKKRPDLEKEENKVTSSVDTNIPAALLTRNDTYALIIGNQNYRFATNVPQAHHDATIFAEYCKVALGIPSEHIHLLLDATKSMIAEQELVDWLAKEVSNREKKKIIVYYAGHGVPDIRNKNKSYLLPVDISGARPYRGISLEEFYTTLGDLGFMQTTVFLDACFSGNSRGKDGVAKGQRATEVDTPNLDPTANNMFVFCATQGNETAQINEKEGHGLFTYYLLKELQSSNNEITFGKLEKGLRENVSKAASNLDQRANQTPKLHYPQSDKDWHIATF